MMKSLVAAGALLILASNASAQIVCKDRSSFLRHLRVSEAVAMGLANNGSVIEKGGGWTIIVTKPNGLSCIVAWAKPTPPVHASLGPQT